MLILLTTWYGKIKPCRLNIFNSSCTHNHFSPTHPAPKTTFHPLVLHYKPLVTHSSCTTNHLSPTGPAPQTTCHGGRMSGMFVPRQRLMKRLSGGNWDRGFSKVVQSRWSFLLIRVTNDILLQIAFTCFNDKYCKTQKNTGIWICCNHWGHLFQDWTIRNTSNKFGISMSAGV